MASPRSEDVAWFCGFFEGEGTFSIANRCLSIGSTDLDVLERVVELFDGKIYDRKNPDHCKRQWVWQLTGWSRVEPLVKEMLPYLGKRRYAKALELLSNAPTYGRYLDSGFCRKGHDLSIKGVWISSGDGRARCRACRNEATARHRAKVNI